MKYEIVQLKEKTVVGVSVTTANSDPQMNEKIGKAWVDLYGGNGVIGVYQDIKNKVNTHSIGLYSDYQSINDQYCLSAVVEVSKNENPELVEKTIPAGKYAKFSVFGNMLTVVAQAWQEIWAMDLDRAFTGDFEEYLNEDMENAHIDIYIAIK